MTGPQGAGPAGGRIECVVMRAQGRLREHWPRCPPGLVKSWTYHEPVAPGTSGGQGLLVSSLKMSLWGMKELLLTKNIDSRDFF